MFRIEKLDRTHDLQEFDCGVEALNRFLRLHALGSQTANATQTYLGLREDKIIGYHTLTVGEVRIDAAPDRLKKGLARHPVPVMVLARLAVDVKWRGIGAGAGLLKDAMLRTVAAASIAGIRAIVVHAKDDAALQFYAHFGFHPGFDNPLYLYMLVKDVRNVLAEREA